MNYISKIANCKVLVATFVCVVCTVLSIRFAYAYDRVYVYTSGDFSLTGTFIPELSNIKNTYVLDVSPRSSLSNSVTLSYESLSDLVFYCNQHGLSTTLAYNSAKSVFVAFVCDYEFKLSELQKVRIVGCLGNSDGKVYVAEAPDSGSDLSKIELFLEGMSENLFYIYEELSAFLTVPDDLLQIISGVKDISTKLSDYLSTLPTKLSDFYTQLSNLDSIATNTLHLRYIAAGVSTIDTRLSTIINQLGTISNALGAGTSSGSGGVSGGGSVTGIVLPIVSAINNLRSDMALYFTDASVDVSTTYTVSSGDTCYIPLPLGSELDLDTMTGDSNSGDLLFFKGRTFARDVKPDGVSILSFDYPFSVTFGTSFASDGLAHFSVDGIPYSFSITDGVLGRTVNLSKVFSWMSDANFDSWVVLFGESGRDWVDGQSLSDADVADAFFADLSAGGVTVLNGTREDFTVDVWSCRGDYESPLYKSVSLITSYLKSISAKFGKGGSTDLTGVITGINNVNANVTALNTSLNTNLDSLVDKLQIVVDNSTTNVENTIVNITNDNDAFNVFYITGEDGDTQSVTDFTGDLTGASGKLLSLLYRLVFANALDTVDDDLDNFEDFFTSQEPVTDTASYGADGTTNEVVSVWDS